MIRFALRQFRVQGIIALSALVALATVCLVTGPNLVHLYDTTVVGCNRFNDCTRADAALSLTAGLLYPWLNILVVLVPAILGTFWGAPLIARELESGTFRLVWTQSVTPRRWLSIKLATVGTASMAVAGLLSLIVTWWASPVDQVVGTPFSTFDARDIVPVAYAAFAFALGAAIGLLLRRVLPAMGVTLATFIGARLAILAWVRPHLAPPVRIVSALGVSGNGIQGGNGLGSGAWVLSKQTINAAGKVVGTNGSFGLVGPAGISFSPLGGVVLPNGKPCSTPGGTHSSPAAVAHALRACLAQLHLRQVIIYQPLSRFWPFQWEESAIYLILAGFLVGFCFWWLRRTYGFSGGKGRVRREPRPISPISKAASRQGSGSRTDGETRTLHEHPREPALADDRTAVISPLRPVLEGDLNPIERRRMTSNESLERVATSGTMTSSSLRRRKT